MHTINPTPFLSALLLYAWYRVSDLIGISGANMEVVIFEVDNGGHSSNSEDWLSFEGGGGSKSDGGGSGGGAISVCLWTPVKCEQCGWSM